MQPELCVPSLGISADPSAVFSSSFGSSGDSVIGQLFSCEMENCSMCRCGKETVRVSSTLLFTLSYPDSTGNSRAQPPPAGWGLLSMNFPAGTHPQPGAAWVSNQPSFWLQKDTFGA